MEEIERSKLLIPDPLTNKEKERIFGVSIEYLTEEDINKRYGEGIYAKVKEGLTPFDYKFSLKDWEKALKDLK